MILKPKIRTKEDIIRLLDSLRPYEEQYISKLSEDSIEYELACEKVQDYLLEIEEVLVGDEELNNKNIANADIRMFTYWDYIGCKITAGKLFKELKTHCSKELLINVD
jgi:hypothetical protein